MSEKEKVGEKSAEELKAQEILEKAQKRERNKKERAPKSDKGPIAYLRGTVTELKAATWPTPSELVRWSLIVVATVAVLAVSSMLIDNFIGTPLMYAISTLPFGSEEFGPFDIALVVILFLSGVGSIVGVYMHAGGDTEGLSDTLASRLTGGSGQAMKNIDRFTIGCIIVFVLVLLVMMVTYPTGYIITQ